MGNSNDNPVPLPKSENNWDGSESELVEDDDAAEYEDHHTGIRLNYKLSDQEIYSCFTHSENYKDRKKYLRLATIVPLVVALIFFALAFFGYNPSIGWVGLAFGVLAFVFYGISEYSLRKRFKYLATTGRKADVEIYPDSIDITESGREWSIKLDGSMTCEEHDNMLLVYLDDNRVFIIPLRCIEPDLVADVQAMVLAGTSPRKEA